MRTEDETDWLAIADALAVPISPEQEQRHRAAQAAWAAQHNRSVMAVARTLSPQENALILRAVNERYRGLRGAQVPDWLEIADNRELFCAEVAVVFERWGAELAEQSGPQARAVIGLATAAAATMYPDDRERMVQQAERLARDTLRSLGEEDEHRA